MLFAINHTQRSFVLFTVWEKEPVLYGIVLSCYHLTRKLSRQPYSFTSSEVIMVCSGSRPWPQHNCSLGVSATGIEFQPLPSFITPNWLPKLAFGRQLPRSFPHLTYIKAPGSPACTNTLELSVRVKLPANLPHARRNSCPHKQTSTHTINMHKHTEWRKSSRFPEGTMKVLSYIAANLSLGC